MYQLCRKSRPLALILELREFLTGHPSTRIHPPRRRLHHPLDWHTIKLVTQLLLAAPATKFLTMRSEPGSRRARRRRRKAEVPMVKGDGAEAEVVAVLVEETVATAGDVVEAVIGGIGGTGVDTGEVVGVVTENLMRRERIDHVEGDYKEI